MTDRFIVPVRADGRTGMKISITKACRASDIKIGDYVQVSIQKVDLQETD